MTYHSIGRVPFAAQMSMSLPASPRVVSRSSLGLMMPGMTITPRFNLTPPPPPPASGSLSDRKMETFRTRALKVILDGWARDLSRARSRTTLASSDDHRAMGRLAQRANAAKQAAAGVAVGGPGLTTRDLEKFEEMKLTGGVMATPQDIDLINRIKGGLKARLLRTAKTLRNEVQSIEGLVRKRRSLPGDTVASPGNRVASPGNRVLVPMLRLPVTKKPHLRLRRTTPTPSSRSSTPVPPPAPPEDDPPSQDYFDPLPPGYAPDGSGTPLVQDEANQGEGGENRIPWTQIALGAGVLAAVGGIFYLVRK